MMAVKNFPEHPPVVSGRRIFDWLVEIARTIEEEEESYSSEDESSHSRSDNVSAAGLLMNSRVGFTARAAAPKSCGFVNEEPKIKDELKVEKRRILTVKLKKPTVASGGADDRRVGVLGKRKAMRGGSAGGKIGKFGEVADLDNVKAKKAKICDLNLDPLSEKVETLVAKMDGSELKCLISKTLTASDVNKGQGRFSIPVRQVTAEFLTESEKTILEVYDKDDLKRKASLDVVLLDPGMRRWNLKLRKWDMKKGNGGVSSIYVLVDSWNKVKEANDLREGDMVQVWSFRSQQPESKLCFMLVRLGRRGGGIIEGDLLSC